MIIDKGVYYLGGKQINIYFLPPKKSAILVENIGQISSYDGILRPICSYDVLVKREKGKWKWSPPASLKETVKQTPPHGQAIMKATFSKGIVSSDKHFWYGTIKSEPVKISFK